MSIDPVADALFRTLAVGAIAVPNRIFMAPLTRSRARHDGDVPTEINAAITRSARLRVC